MNLKCIHHIAIICSDYQRSKKFYVDILGLEIMAEYFREERNSYKLDLKLDTTYVLELFSFEHPPARVNNPEACGLRHLAFGVENVEACKRELEQKNIDVEPVRIDEATGKKFTFFRDPDDLPLELYEM